MDRSLADAFEELYWTGRALKPATLSASAWTDDEADAGGHRRRPKRTTASSARIGRAAEGTEGSHAAAEGGEEEVTMEQASALAGLLLLAVLVWIVFDWRRVSRQSQRTAVRERDDEDQDAGHC